MFSFSICETGKRKEAMKELKDRLKKAKIDRKELAAKIGVPYMTLSGYLNDFVPMPDHVRQAIEDVLREASK